MLTVLSSSRHFLYNSHVLYYIRIFIALTGTTLVPWLLGEEPKMTIPLTLGVVAAALTDLDDRLVGRLRNLVITLVSFFAASTSITLLFPYPWLFMVGLAVSTCSFILLGALGQRYATIAFGALLIAIYTMLGTSIFPLWYQQPLLLLTGAIWYNLLTLTGHLLFPIRPLQENLARCYQQLSAYLYAKTSLFDPDSEAEEYKQSMFDVAMANSTLVTTLNQAKISLLSRLKGDRGQRGTRHTLHYYFVAQDIHERASSSHVQYQKLRETFRHSDILFRCQRLLSMQARACEQVSQSIILRKPYQHNSRFENAFNYLESSLERLKNQQGADTQIMAFYNLLRNLRAIDAQLSGLNSEQSPLLQNASQGGKQEDTQLSDEALTGWRDVWFRISSNLTPKSALFRHAIRMSALLCTGYAIIQLFDLQRGYWILLTSLFVCQPNYNATRRRLALRVIGTLAGILIGLPILYFVPSIEGQLVLIIISGVLFFAFRNIQYAHATLFITLLVLLSFNLLGEGFEVALPRITDTLIGCGIALLAVSFIWPDWKFRQLPRVINRTMIANCRYLDAIVGQYYQGKNNSLNYRIARRDAHNCDAELASVISNMASEPKNYRVSQEEAFRLLCLNHTMLSYISALGAHRDRLNNQVILDILNDAIFQVESALQQGRVDDEHLQRISERLAESINLVSSDSSGKMQLVLQQIGLLVELLPEFVSLIKQLTQSDI
ncbi:YccS family putative transporter [Xenorhabdus bovienii]|uniref:YccS family putative transporter n=1 Tax=Xenorhabdus bovienii TaxID=40576 RepID=UPI0023B2EA6C|nr:YccS family putative transporter [Xenorhabdus bovienii]MDE9431410.1 TIGR01666 family membrane protein [Xenorhabdus bovienii]MDE9489152.1 TIGR01666 family membrane protein [Xenorhabdus bovienii]MDE9505402.1 TIGR01666 family membrane protein [Xenorhabdus bovienii]MDE9547765.1 TIGR01666 family membrane protein [Xenorhabdus bovienii]